MHIWTTRLPNSSAIKELCLLYSVTDNSTEEYWTINITFSQYSNQVAIWANNYFRYKVAVISFV